MYKTRGYPIDYDLRRARLVQRNPYRFNGVRAFAARLAIRGANRRPQC